MCLMVWLGSEVPLVRVALPRATGSATVYFRVTPEAPEAPVRVQLDQPHVYYVGSHEGCGCGFRSRALGLEGLRAFAEVLPLLPALLDDEREELLAEQRSREFLSDVIREALLGGKVEVLSCWAGEEAEPPSVVKDVSPEYFSAFLDPLAEGGKYRVHPAQ